MNRFLKIAALLALPALAAGQETNASARQPHISYFTETSRPASEIKSIFPYDIALRTAEGDTLNSAGVFAQNGKPTVLMFWLTTCVPCRYELAAVAKKYEAWQEEAPFNLYTISVDFPKNYGNFVKRVNDSAWPFPAYHDTNREFRLVMPGALNGLPQTFVLNKAGDIVRQKRKYSPGEEDELFEFVKTLK
jgi:cytochrome c biogenesis protein CcmG, thiol:disulfide interchange protein DsbE